MIKVNKNIPILDIAQNKLAFYLWHCRYTTLKKVQDQDPFSHDHDKMSKASANIDALYAGSLC